MTLAPDALAAELAALPRWTFDPARGGLITREFRFDGFAQAFAFMTQTALHAERADHHPEWSNVYDRVQVVLTTHDAGGVTAKDVALARRMDRIAAAFEALTAPATDAMRTAAVTPRPAA